VTLRSFIDKNFGGSQAAFADKAGLDRGRLSNYLRAERGEGGGRPNADSLAKIEKHAGPEFGSSYWSKIDPEANLPKARRPRRTAAHSAA
jgi:transcriptional regulator with XRE-family HTH domain